jgi:hypothetical protein
VKTPLVFIDDVGDVEALLGDFGWLGSIELLFRAEFVGIGLPSVNDFSGNGFGEFIQGWLFPEQV